MNLEISWPRPPLSNTRGRLQWVQELGYRPLPGGLWHYPRCLPYIVVHNIHFVRDYYLMVARCVPMVMKVDFDHPLPESVSQLMTEKFQAAAQKLYRAPKSWWLALRPYGAHIILMAELSGKSRSDCPELLTNWVVDRLPADPFLVHVIRSHG